MDPVRNPFAPGAGSPPPELAGRHEIIEQTLTVLRRTAQKRPTQSPILVGLRGVGKTVLLVKIQQMAEDEGFRTIYAEAHEGKTLPELILPGVRQALFSLSAVENAKDKARRGLRVLKSFVNGLKVSVGEIEIGLSIDPETGSADSGDIESDLPELVVAVGEAAAAAGKPIALFIDELQYLTNKEFSSLIMAIHRTTQRGLPVILIAAGLPQILGLAGNSKSYAERLFTYPDIGALKEIDARRAIVAPIEDEGVRIEDAAVEQILTVTERYPYFLQQWGHEAWNVAQDDIIRAKDVFQANNNALAKLDESFFKVRFERCTRGEKRYMRALAELGSGASRSGDVADILQVKVTSLGPVRSSLIKKGMIYSPNHGDVDFTVPLFHKYMMRVMPSL